MTMSTQCKWISFAVMSLTVVLLLLLFYGLQKKSRCPEENHLRYKENGQCYLKNTNGPCQEGFIFSEFEHKSHQGSCSCPYMLTNRTILYNKGQCYYIFSQANCPEDHWLNVNARGEPFCEMNRCIQTAKNSFKDDKSANDDGEVDMKSTDQFDQNMHDMHGHRAEMIRSPIEWVPIKDGRCAILGQHTEGCPDESVVRFHSNYKLPTCFDPPAKKFGMSSGAIGVGAYMSPCPFGSAKAITGFCQPLFDFDFEEPTDKSDSERS